MIEFLVSLILSSAYGFSFVYIYKRDGKLKYTDFLFFIYLLIPFCVGYCPRHMEYKYEITYTVALYINLCALFLGTMYGVLLTNLYYINKDNKGQIIN